MESWIEIEALEVGETHGGTGETSEGEVPDGRGGQQRAAEGSRGRGAEGCRTGEEGSRGRQRAAEREVPKGAGRARRAAEGEAWRAIVRRRLGPDTTTGYNKNGAPILEGAGKGFIGVSHTEGWVAVVWSPRPCAIDIELKTRRLSDGVAARYKIDSMADWCALEATYKFEGLAGQSPEAGSVRFVQHPELIVAVIS